MFGYVVPNQAALSDEAQKRYRTAYCGLCRRIDALHGLRGRFTLSYDLTFLNLLLCSPVRGRDRSFFRPRPVPHPPLGRCGMAGGLPHRLLCRSECSLALLQRRG